MLNKTRGLVFQTIKFSETSVIAKIFTEEAGLESFMVNSVRSKKSKNKAAALFPLTALDLVVQTKENRSIQRITEMKINPPFQSIHSDIRKSSIVLFLADILKRAVHEHETNTNLFRFIFHSMEVLDVKSDHLGIFHLSFLMQLSRHLGFFPAGEYSPTNSYFSLQEGVYQDRAPIHPPYLEGRAANDFYDLSQLGFDTLEELSLSKEARKNLLENILIYFQLHLPSFSGIHSHEILAEVLG